MATIFKTDGSFQKVVPENGENFSLEELYGLLNVKCVEVLYMGEDEVLIIDEEGKFHSELNQRATELCRNKYAIFPDDYIAGDALLCDLVEFS